MKIVFICLFACLQGLPSLDCASFYEKELKPLLLEGVVVEKLLTDDYYIIKVEQDVSKKQISVRLLKNSTGRDVYWFITKGSIIRKGVGRCDLHFLKPTPNDGYEGRIFNELCK